MKKKNKNTDVFLSKDIIPIKYNIELKPDLDNFTFEGIETINLLVKRNTKKIVLHSKEIEIKTASIILNKEKIFAKNISYNENTETVEISFKENLIGKLNITLVFKGILNDKMRGFYRSKYIIGNTVHHIATTQFEATDARRAFPCFDEPAKKAIFDVSLVVKKGKTAISNTFPVSVKEHEGEYEIVKFSSTPKMSTYLLLFIIGDFEYIESKTKNNISVRVFTTKGKKHQAKFALSSAIRILDFYEKYFDIPYPLPVLDMIAIPDFSSGAMENWGAITYRESAILVDEENSSISNKQWVALVIAHEIAHQWFGNLVTMKWWTHLWLNEGFASYIEYLAIDKIFSKWDIWTQFATADLGVALRLDSLTNTHPIEIPVHHPSEIGEIFDEVSYSKGASIIRMLASYLGEKDFKNGLRYYLKKHSYKNTETIDLWKAFEKISKKHVIKMMNTWTSKPGYPVIKAHLENDKLNISQERFFSSPISKSKIKDDTIWEINPKNYIDKDYIKLNFNEEGFYRTMYSEKMLEKLKKPILNKKLSPINRLGIIRDLFALAEGGMIKTIDVLSFIFAYKNENNYTVWLEIITGFSKLEQIFTKNKNIINGLNKLIISLLSPSFKRLGFSEKKEELHTDTLLRPLIISRLGKSGDKNIISETKNLFKLMQNGEQINPNIRGVIYQIIAKYGDEKEHNILIKKYKTETLHEEKNRIGVALGDFTQNKILCLSTHFAFSDDVRIQDTISILSSIGINPLGRDIWFKCLKQNWKIILSRYGDGGMLLSKIVKAISGTAEKKHLDQFKNFFSINNAPGAKRSIEQVLERIEGNILWLKRDKKEIEKFLTK